MKKYRKKLLIVEDEAVCAMLLRAELEFLGLDVVDTVSTGEAAVASALAKNPEYILMDIFLAGKMNGIETAESLNEICGSNLIFVTAYGDPAIRHKAMMTNPLAYIVKPADVNEIYKLINGHMRF